MTDLLIQVDQGKPLTEETLLIYIGEDVRIALLVRAFIGIDQLSTESMKLFTAQEDFQRVANITADNFRMLPIVAIKHSMIDLMVTRTYFPILARLNSSSSDSCSRSPEALR